MINSVTNNKINFTSTRLYKVKINKLMPDNTYMSVDAYFSQLKNNATNDKAIQKLAETWNWSDYLTSIVRSYKSNSHDTFCIETIGKEPLHQRIKAIMSRADLSQTNEGNDMLASYISAAPNVKYNPNNAKREFTDVGKASIYGTVRLTKDKNLNRLLIKSENDKFFDAIGITKSVYEDGEDFRFLAKEDFDEFLKKC